MDYKLSNEAVEFIKFLHRGGTHAYYWMLDEVRTFRSKNTGQDEKCRRSAWFETSAMPTTVRAADTEHVYFGVFPASKPGEWWKRVKNDDVPAINCLFTELDAKDARYGSMDAVWERVNNLDPLPQPSVIIHSGGGLHLYWLLHEPFELTADNRQGVKDLLKRWVAEIGGDDVKDLARVLRVPGTVNIKPKYAPNYPTVHFAKRDMGLLYDLAELAVFVPAPPRPVYHQSEHRVYSVGDFAVNPAQQYIDAAMNLVNMASHGNGLHFAVRTASCQLGRVVGAELLPKDEAISMLENAVYAKAKDFSNACRTIRSGIELGMSSPFVVLERPVRPEPVMACGRAYCPYHKHRPLERGRKGGWYCQARSADTANGYCDYRWDGAGYNPPQTAKERFEAMRVHPVAR